MSLDLSLKTDRDNLEEIIKEDINNYCVELTRSNEYRNHLGASVMGDQCWRKLYSKFRWFRKPEFDGRMQRLFNVGHEAEPRFIKYLKGIGFQVQERDPSTGEQWRISGAKGHYGGSLDGQCIAPERYQLSTPLVLLNEFKTQNTGKKFTDVAIMDLSKSKPKHYAQCCQYGEKYGLKYALYMIENKNDSDIIVRIVELDWNYGKALERKAEEIIFATEPPPKIAENESFFDCKYCDEFRDICHNGAKPDKNCRSCRHSTPVDNAEWHCSRFNGIIPQDFIPNGCPDWNAI